MGDRRSYMTLFDVAVERLEYSYYRYDAENAPPAEELFDVARVPNELTNRRHSTTNSTCTGRKTV